MRRRGSKAQLRFEKITPTSRYYVIPGEVEESLISSDPKLCASAKDRNGDEQKDEIAFQAKEISQSASATQPRLIRRLHSASSA
jgi:hypothetical protein